MSRLDLESSETFLRWAENAEPAVLVEGLLTLTDADRRRLAKPVAAAWRKAHPDRWTRHEWHLDLALLAVCSWSDVQRFRLGDARWVWQWREEMVGGVFAVLDGRRPAWLDRWVERELESSDRVTDWRLIRQLVRSGACPVPSGDGYIIQMIRSRAGAGSVQESLAETLRADPGLLENEIWRIFEIDPVSQSLFQYDEASWARERYPVSWGEALVALAATGEIDRQRLLSCSLATLRSGLQLRDATFYVRMQERLEPTPEELQGLADALLDLLSHPVDAVARYGVSCLSVLLETGRILPARIVERAPAGLLRRTKSLPMATVKLLRLAAKAAPELGRNIAEAALEGLGHSSPDVQAGILDLVERVVPGPDPELASRLADHVERLTPSQRERGLALQQGLASSETTAVVPSAPPAQPDDHDLVAEARSLSPRAREMTGIDRILAALEAGDAPPMVDPAAASMPRLDDDHRVVPLESLDATIDCAASIFERAEDALEAERALDGLSRFANQRPGDLRERTAALLQRAAQPGDGMGMATMAALTLGGLVCRWLGQHVPKYILWRHSEGPGIDAFLQARADEVWDRVRAGISAETLALPTHRGGWIDSRELAARLRRYQDARCAVSACDFIQALLRLAPDHRDEASRAAAGLDGEPGRVLRFALGGNERPSERGGPSLWGKLKTSVTRSTPQDAAWGAWAAAARARAPFADVPELTGTPVEAEPWAVRAPVIDWSVRTETIRWSTFEPHVAVCINPPGDKQGAVHHPLSLLAQEFRVFSTADVRLTALVWPANPDPLLVAGCHAICDRLFRPASTWTPTAAYLEPLLDPAARLTDLANLALVLGLVSKDTDARQMATEVAATAMRDGRSDGRALGATIARLAQTDGVVMLGRVGKAVGDLVLRGAAQQRACAMLLEELLASFAKMPRDAHHLLAPYYELLIATGRSADQRLVPLLQGVTGSGKTATIARKLQKLDAQPERIVVAHRAACAEVLGARLDHGRVLASRLTS